MDEKKGWDTLGWRVISFFNHARCFLWCSGQVSVYCAGFPCTPFSMLHYASELLQDPNARQLLKVVSNCRVVEPGVSWSTIDEISNLTVQSRSNLHEHNAVPSKVIVLENVMGFLRCLKKVEKLLRANLPGHLIPKMLTGVSKTIMFSKELGVLIFQGTSWLWLSWTRPFFCIQCYIQKLFNMTSCQACIQKLPKLLKLNPMESFECLKV